MQIQFLHFRSLNHGLNKIMLSNNHHIGDTAQCRFVQMSFLYLQMHADSPSQLLLPSAKLTLTSPETGKLPPANGIPDVPFSCAPVHPSTHQPKCLPATPPCGNLRSVTVLNTGRVHRYLWEPLTLFRLPSQAFFLQ